MSTVSAPAAPLQRPSISDEALYEVVNGQRVELPPMAISSAWLASILYLELGGFVRARRLGRAVVEGLFILDQDKDLRRRPDIAYVAAERWPLDRPIPPVGDWAVVPNLAIEVMSPNDGYEELMAKLEEYFRYGVEQSWVISPSQRVMTVYDSLSRFRGLGEADVLTDTVVPGFSLKLADLFRQAV